MRACRAFLLLSAATCAYVPTATQAQATIAFRPTEECRIAEGLLENVQRSGECGAALVAHVLLRAMSHTGVPMDSNDVATTCKKECFGAFVKPLRATYENQCLLDMEFQRQLDLDAKLLLACPQAGGETATTTAAEQTTTTTTATTATTPTTTYVHHDSYKVKRGMKSEYVALTIFGVFFGMFLLAYGMIKFMHYRGMLDDDEAPVIQMGYIDISGYD